MEFRHSKRMNLNLRLHTEKLRPYNRGRLAPAFSKDLKGRNFQPFVLNNQT